MSDVRDSHLLGDVVYKASVICNRIGTAIILCMMLLTTVDVVLRGVFHSPITGAFEATGLMMLMVVILGLSYTQFKKGHVSVDLFTSRLTGRARAVNDVFVYLICLGIYVLISWQAVVGGRRQQIANVIVSDVVRIPVCPFYYVLAFGSVILCLVFVLDIIDALHSLRGGTKR